MNVTNPKRIAAAVFFVLAIIFLGLMALVALSGGLGSTNCTAEEKALNLSKCNTNPLTGFLAGGVGGFICCFPIALLLFVAGAMLWSGAKKDDLRDLEIGEYKKGRKVDKKTESF